MMDLQLWMSYQRKIVNRGPDGMLTVAAVGYRVVRCACT